MAVLSEPSPLLRVTVADVLAAREGRRGAGSAQRIDREGEDRLNGLLAACLTPTALYEAVGVAVAVRELQQARVIEAAVVFSGVIKTSEHALSGAHPSLESMPGVGSWTSGSRGGGVTATQQPAS